MASPLGALNYLPFAGGLAGGGTAASTAAGGAGLAAFGPYMLGATALSTLGGLVGGSQQSSAQAAQTQLQGMYTKLAPLAPMISAASQEMIANMAPYFGAQAMQTNLLGQSMYDIFTGAKSKESQLAGLQTGIASKAAESALDVQKGAAMGRLAAGLKGVETQAEMAKKGADVLGAQYLNLAKGLTDVGTSAANTRNQQVMAQTMANLDIGKMGAAKQFETAAELAKRREARGAAMGGSFA